MFSSLKPTILSHGTKQNVHGNLGHTPEDGKQKVSNFVFSACPSKSKIMPSDENNFHGHASVDLNPLMLKKKHPQQKFKNRMATSYLTTVVVAPPPPSIPNTSLIVTPITERCNENVCTF